MDMERRRVIITGTAAEAVRPALRARLDGLGAGDIAVEETAGGAASEGVFCYALGVHDTVSLAVEKIVDALDARGWICLDAGRLSAEEEAQIRARLQGLGYVD